ncbi:hypothetical protein [Nocardioides insulae]|uniref:hypothetical protein n=1 Tax=Nocardioides insulae TaxID=394734 RepID=UPI00041AA8FA|nr:hypothetical protein [Nocardioides insulae]
MSLPFGPVLRQPDGYSCGAACIVVARLLRTRVTPLASAFAPDVLRTHRELVGLTDREGHAQLPWPRHLGTPPWAIAHALAGIEGVPYAVKVARHEPESLFAAARDAVGEGRAGHPVALYVGNRFLPRHVVLALEPSDTGALRCYDPASGTLRTASPWAFTHGELHLGGWTHPWFVVLPH